MLFIKKIVINLPKVEIVAKPEVILAVLEKEKAVRTDGVLTAVSAWLPSPPQAETADPVVNPPAADSAN